MSITSSTSAPAEERVNAFTIRDSSGTRRPYSRCSVSGVYSYVSVPATHMMGRSYAFWTLVVLLVYPAHPLEFRTDVVAATNQLDRIAQLHLPVRVHEPLFLQLLAPAGLCGL